MKNVKNKIKQQILEQVSVGQTVTYNGKQYIITHVYTQPTTDPQLDQTLPTDPTKYPVYALQSTDGSNETILVTKDGQTQFGG